METSASEFLKNELAQRQRKNPHYSLRAYARDLDLHAGTLSAVMAGKRALPSREALRISQSLGLSPRQTQNLLGRQPVSFGVSPEAKGSRQILDSELNFRILSEWEYFAVLSLMETADFRPEIEQISQRLGISPMRAGIVFKGLTDAGLIQIDGTQWVKTERDIHTSEDIESAALQRAHIEELELARRKIETVNILLRDFSSLCFATSGSKLPQIKDLIREFRQRVLSFAENETETHDHVYQLCIQLFPLTRPTEESVHVDRH
jgi:plasmid maintenance system antidote protein VapI